MSGAQEPPLMVGLDLREMTFQNVVDNILGPSGIKIGGFPEELFLNLAEQEHRDMMCNICFLIANDCRLCDNEHVFCHSCIIAWTMTFGENAHKCPVCRCDQSEYNESDELQKHIDSKQVRCCEDGCCFESTLVEFLLHDHGKAAYSNAHVDFSCFSQRLIQQSFTHDNSSSAVLSTSSRSQLLQSRTMIQQMMMLMRIEMQLQQQALFNLQQDVDVERTPGLDSTLALDSQLSEISSVLSTLIRSTSVGQRSGGRRRPTHRDLHGAQRLRRTDVSAFARSAALRRLSSISARQWREIDGTVNDDSSSTDENAEESGDDDVLDMNNTAPLNDVDVDDFIWQQLNVTADETTVDNIRSSPEGMSTASSVPDFHDLSAVQSLASFQSLPSISSVPSSQSLSYISTVSSYAPSESPSLSCEGRQVMSRCVVCMSRYEPPISQEQCLCHACGVFDSVSVFDDGDDRPLVGSHHEIRPQPVLSCEETSQSRSWQMDVTHPTTGAQSAHDRHSFECMSTCPTHGMPPVTNTVHRTLPPLTGAGHSLMTSVPTVDPVCPLSSLPGTLRPPHFNYAGRLRRQASEMTHLPSEVSIRPWPLPAAGHSVVDNHLPSATVNSFTSRRTAPSYRASSRQLPTYNLSVYQRSAAASALPVGSTHRGRGTRPARYNTSLSRRARP